MRPTLFLLLLAFAVFADDKKDALEFPPMPPVVPHSPADELKTMQLPSGYHLQLVLSEPEIKEPHIAAFDGDGRMFVA